MLCRKCGSDAWSVKDQKSGTGDEGYSDDASAAKEPGHFEVR